MTDVSSRLGFGLNCAIAASAIPIGPPVALLFVPAEATSGVELELLVVFKFTKQLAVVTPQVPPVGEFACSPVASFAGPLKNVYLRVGERLNGFAISHAVQSEKPSGRTGAF